MTWSHRYYVATFLEARDGAFDEDEELVHAIAAQCQEFIAGAYRFVDGRRTLIRNLPEVRPLLGIWSVVEGLDLPGGPLLDFALEVSEGFKLDKELAPGEMTAEGSYYRIGPRFPDFPPADLIFDIDSYDRDLKTVLLLVAEATRLVAKIHRMLDWRGDVN